MRAVILAIAAICTGCGGFMDYTVNPIDIRGNVMDRMDRPLIVATPGYKYGPEECADFISRGSLEACSAQVVRSEADGTFNTIVREGRRGCMYLLVPPLLSAFCDYKSYLLVAVPTEPVEVYSIVISSRKAKVSRVRPPDSDAAPLLTVVSTTEEVNDLGGYSKDKHSITLTVRGK
jgi:hypothetical protein